MLRLKFSRRTAILLLGILIAAQCVYVFAQEEQKTTQPKQSREECLRNFNINQIDYMDVKVINNIFLLAEYFQCRAAAKDDIGECNRLTPRSDYVANCRKYFNFYRGFYASLLIEGRAIPQAISSCVSNIKMTREECESFAKAWLANDILFAEKYRTNKTRYDEYRAMISGDASSCKAESCSNQSNFVRAIKTRDIRACGDIKDKLALSMCQGVVSLDEKVCENNKGFRDFRSKYCE